MKLPFLLAVVLVLVLFMAGCQPTGQVVLETPGLETHETSLLVENFDLEVQEAFKTAVQETKPNTKEQRAVYEEYLDELGSNGITKALNDINPVCHSEGHELGKVFYAELKDLPSAFLACEDVCYSGCTHGVLMEAFMLPEHEHDPGIVDHEHHVQPEEVYPLLEGACNKNMGIRAGDCAHGIGHALTGLNAYNIVEAEKGCEFFNNSSMEYYCATGAYMEYVEQPRNKKKALFEPCDTAKFPAACFRYIMPFVFTNVTAQLGIGGIRKVIDACKGLSTFTRIGCFHGVGNAHVHMVRNGAMKLGELCSFGTEQDNLACIDGAIERLSKYYGIEAALEVCSTLDKHKQFCKEGAEGQLYRMDKSFTLYHPELFG